MPHRSESVTVTLPPRELPEKDGVLLLIKSNLYPTAMAAGLAAAIYGMFIWWSQTLPQIYTPLAEESAPVIEPKPADLAPQNAHATNNENQPTRTPSSELQTTISSKSVATSQPTQSRNAPASKSSSKAAPPSRQSSPANRTQDRSQPQDKPTPPASEPSPSRGLVEDVARDPVGTVERTATSVADLL